MAFSILHNSFPLVSSLQSQLIVPEELLSGELWLWKLLWKCLFITVNGSNIIHWKISAQPRDLEGKRHHRFTSSWFLKYQLLFHMMKRTFSFKGKIPPKSEAKNTVPWLHRSGFKTQYKFLVTCMWIQCQAVVTTSPSSLMSIRLIWNLRVFCNISVDA